MRHNLRLPFRSIRCIIMLTALSASSVAAYAFISSSRIGSAS